MTENREVKSDVFSMLMENKAYALEVYNALNDSDYSDPNLVETVTLEKGISLTVRNDAAFIVDMNLNIYEHQSTYSPNIPLRALMYLAETLKPILKERDIYGRNKVLIPTPGFAVFYNGRENRPDKEVLKLSDLFAKPGHNPEAELCCTVYNINSDKGSNFLDHCPVLREYTQFIEKIRIYESEGHDTPVQSAINWCIENHILENFLRSRAPEVLKAMTLDMTFEHREEIIRREVREEGIKKGLIQGKADSILDILRLKGDISEEIKQKIYSKENAETLSKWLILAASCSSVEEFAEKIK